MKILIENVNVIKSWPCFNGDNEWSVLTSLQHVPIKYLIDSFEKDLIKYGSQHRTNLTAGVITFEKYETAGEMFIYLTLCPKFMFEWTQLYIDLLLQSPPDVIVQTVNRIMINGRIKRDNIVTNIARKLFKRIDDKLSLKYKIIDHFSQTEKKISHIPNNNTSSAQLDRGNDIITLCIKTR